MGTTSDQVTQVHSLGYGVRVCDMSRRTTGSMVWMYGLLRRSFEWEFGTVYRTSLRDLSD